MQKHIEKTEQLIKKIDSILENKKANIEYGDKFQRMQLQVQKINDWSRNIKRRSDNSEYREDQDIVQTMNKLIFACEDIQQYIKIDDITEISLPKLKESLTNVKNAQEHSYNQASYADIMDKILLIEESYQNGKMINTENQEKKFNAEKAVKELSKLEKLPILQDGSAESKQLIEIIKNHKKEMGVTVDSDKQYKQDIKPNEHLEETFTAMEQVVDGKLNELMSLEDVSGGYRPEFEDLCERVDIIIRDFVDAEGSLYDSTNLSNLFNEATKLTSQFKIAFNEQQQKLNQSNQKETLNFHIQHITKVCEEIDQKDIPLSSIDSQLDIGNEQIKKFENLAQNMPASVFEESCKFLYNHYGNNIIQAMNFHNQGLLSEDMRIKCQNFAEPIQRLLTNAEQLGIQL
ncbi:MAG: hypothetical protein IJ415_03230 [Clostridia bacterium]|nr:hypothetical protein [Clostridia bacterium]